MPVQFHCHHCHRRLSIGRRKVGAEVNCPKCGQTLVVPNQEEADAAGLPTAPDVAVSDEDFAIPEMAIYDDFPPIAERSSSRRSAIAERPAFAERSEPAPALLARAAADHRIETDRPARASPRRGRQGELVISRNALYLQALLFVAIAAAAFGAGYAIGSGRPRDATSLAPEFAPGEAVAIEGNVEYLAETGDSFGDGGAVVFAVPADLKLDTKLSTEGLRPDDPEPPPDQPQLQALRRAGGARARARDDGAYSLVVPRPGRYQILIVSGRIHRPKDTPIPPADLVRLGEVFVDAGTFIGDRKYRLTAQRAEQGVLTVNHDFGRDGQ